MQLLEPKNYGLTESLQPSGVPSLVFFFLILSLLPLLLLSFILFFVVSRVAPFFYIGRWLLWGSIYEISWEPVFTYLKLHRYRKTFMDTRYMILLSAPVSFSKANMAWSVRVIRLFRAIVVDVVHKVSEVVLELVDVYLVQKINRKVLLDLRDDTCNVRMFGMLRVHLIFWLKI